MHAYREHILELAVNNSIPAISGPQTLLRSSQDSKVASKMNNIGKNAPPGNLVLTWRQHDSFIYSTKHYSGVKSIEVPDMVFMIGPLIAPKAPSFDVTVHLRDDDESILNGLTARTLCEAIVEKKLTCKVRICIHPPMLNCLFFSPIRRNRILIQVISWVEPEIVPTRQDHGNTAFFASRLQQGVAVSTLGTVAITDRLHGGMIPYLAGMGVVYIDTKNKKTTGVFSTAFAGLKAPLVGSSVDCWKGDKGMCAILILLKHNLF